MTTPSGYKLTLVSSDDQQFEVDVTAAVKSLQLKRMIEDDCAGEQIPLPNVSGNILAKIIEYCNKHAAHEAAKTNDQDSDAADNAKLKKWDAEFIAVDMDTLFELIMAANYMEIKSLLDLTCKTVADKIRGKTPEELRQLFNIKNDFTPEEEEEIRSENQWAFE